ncbi:MAG TPA: hypothetical protein ENI59_00005 [Euryarchaeota archaeon]|nr:hypothetical protein [Euryarchaeota archaeon]
MHYLILLLLAGSLKTYSNIDDDYRTNHKQPNATAWKIYKICEDYEIAPGDTLILGPITDYELYKYHSVEVIVEGVDSIAVAFKVLFFDVSLSDVRGKVYPFNALTYLPGITVTSLDVLGIPLSRIMYLHCNVYGSRNGTLSVYYMVSSESR